MSLPNVQGPGTEVASPAGESDQLGPRVPEVEDLDTRPFTPDPGSNAGQVVRAFAEGWLAGGRPRIEEVIATVSEDRRARLLSVLLAVEVSARTKLGESPALLEYLVRFPDTPTVVQRAFGEASTVGLAGLREAETVERLGSTIEGDGRENVPAGRGGRDTATDTVAAPGPSPELIGRYRVIGAGPIGGGGFGFVYLGHDDNLDRPVAIKVPRPERMSSSSDVESFLFEARVLARLDHANILPVYDSGRAADGRCFLVSKWIEGSTLRERLDQGRLPHREAARMVADVARALHHAHEAGIIHRDVKPSNILLDGSGRPIVSDFGLALRETDCARVTTVAGTFAYMSPEQARGEGHLVDCRSDVFSLGVVFYEMLTGRRAFRAESPALLLHQIVNVDVRAPRELDDRISRELERVCLKALSRERSGRYATALELADDLGAYLGAAEQGGSKLISTLPAPARVVPKGLRSFDEYDADFFLQLLAGPRDREGLPESLRFWKTRIESTEPGRSFRVGLVYGPSGCGKSSLIRAGLLPKLAPGLETVYVEATPGDTEARLSSGLRAALPALAGHPMALPVALSEIRRGQLAGPGAKVLVVLDQFEQWLFAHPEPSDSELVAALRQCDGTTVQALILVRDDFWAAASRFLRALDTRLIEGENSAMVDLFPPDHARGVMTIFGQAYGALPEPPGQLGAEHQRFLDLAIGGLTQDGKIVPVRLALFAEMVKGKSWTPTTYDQVGGTTGVGVTFLEETFSAAGAPARYRMHQEAVRGVLKALLPDAGTDIKGRMRSVDDLRTASGLGEGPEFESLIEVLDHELRLITPTGPDDPSAAAHTTAGCTGGHYQLTHDYLVHSLRDWLTKKKRETRKGRAELALAECAALWSGNREGRSLPSFSEWLNIRLSTRKRDWTGLQSEVMRAATARVRRRGAVLALSLTAVLVVMGLAWKNAEDLRRRQEVKSVVSQLLLSDWEHVPEVLEQVDRLGAEAQIELKRVAGNTARLERERVRARVAIAPKRLEAARALVDAIDTSDQSSLRVVRERLRPWAGELASGLWSRVERPAGASETRLPRACLLAEFDPNSRRWPSLMPEIARELASESDPLRFAGWVALLRPVGGPLSEALCQVALDPTIDESGQLNAASAVAQFADEVPARIEPLLLDADERELMVLSRAIVRDRGRILARLRVELAGTGLSTPARRANAALVLALLDDWPSVWPNLGRSADPDVRTRLVHQLSTVGVPAPAIAAGLDSPLEPMVRQALLLALGEYPAERLAPADLDRFVERCQTLLETDPDAGVHSAAEWLLRHWGRDELIEQAVSRLQGKSVGNWFVNGQGLTMVVVRGPVEFSMGTPEADPLRDEAEVRFRRRIGRSFAISAHEVTATQVRRLVPDYHRSERGLSRTAPATNLSWYGAVAYCRALTVAEGLGEDEQCYPPNVSPQSKLPANFLSRKGYRLPTEAEWELACRAGVDSRRFFGDDDRYLPRYGWYNANSNDHLWPVGSLEPNPWGLFDVYGNVMEWCQETPVTPEVIAARSGTVDDDHFGPDCAQSFLRSERGGDYRKPPGEVRTAKRFSQYPQTAASFQGLRVARTMP